VGQGRTTICTKAIQSLAFYCPNLSAVMFSTKPVTNPFEAMIKTTKVQFFQKPSQSFLRWRLALSSAV
jgi:hypothetical protein